MGEPLITMIMCCYNQEGVVGDAIAAALAQDYSPLELVLSDDCSSDNTFGAMQRAVGGYEGPHRVVLNRNERNLGIAAHIDRVTELASAEFIVGGAGDDCSLPHRVRRFADAWVASNRTANVIHGSCHVLNDEGMKTGIARPRTAIRRTPEPLRFIRDGLYVIGANMGWSKRLNDQFGPVARHALIEDHVLPFRAALIGQIVYLDEPLVLKRPGGVANLRVATTGFDALFGLHLRELPWKIADLRQFDADLERVERADAADIRAEIQYLLTFHLMEHRMATASGPRRAAMLPRDVAWALRHRRRHYLTRALLYSGAPLTTRVLDGRMRGAASAQPAADPS